MEYPVCKINACKYSELACNTPVINKNSLDSYIWIRVPSEISREFVLFQVDELVPEFKEFKFLNVIEQQCSKPWFKADINEMNLDSGQHVYKMSFVNRITNDTCSLYFSYIIQDDNPDKPYIYMKRD